MMFENSLRVLNDHAEQFSKCANLFFLITALIQQIPGVSPTNQYTTIVLLTRGGCQIHRVTGHIAHRPCEVRRPFRKCLRLEQHAQAWSSLLDEQSTTSSSIGQQVLRPSFGGSGQPG